MRKLLAKRGLVLTLVLFIGLSSGFALNHTRPMPEVLPATKSAVPPEPEPPANAGTPVRAGASTSVPEPLATASSSPGTIERGRKVYAAQSCATCHAIAGSGNPRYPLDDVGDWHTAETIVPWILATEPAASNLSAGVVRRKQRYRSMPADDLTALVSYLISLRSEPAEK